jgi:hypothetical protein
VWVYTEERTYLSLERALEENQWVHSTLLSYYFFVGSIYQSSRATF